MSTRIPLYESSEREFSIKKAALIVEVLMVLYHWYSGIGPAEAYQVAGVLAMCECHPVRASHHVNRTGESAHSALCHSASTSRLPDCDNARSVKPISECTIPIAA